MSSSQRLESDRELSKSQETLDKEDKIERLYEAISYHQGKIEEYDWEIKLIGGRARIRKREAKMEPPF